MREAEMVLSADLDAHFGADRLSLLQEKKLGGLGEFLNLWLPRPQFAQSVEGRSQIIGNRDCQTDATQSQFSQSLPGSCSAELTPLSESSGTVGLEVFA